MVKQQDKNAFHIFLSKNELDWFWSHSILKHEILQVGAVFSFLSFNPWCATEIGKAFVQNI